MTEDDIRSLLKEMRDEAVPADSLVRVRTAVAGARTRKAPSHWMPFAGLAAFAALLVLMFVIPSADQVPPPPPIVAKISTPELVKAKPITPAVHRRVPRPPRAAKPTTDGTVVRIETADPDVVILLLGD